MLDENDRWIAVTALRFGLPLVANDAKTFPRSRGLKLLTYGLVAPRVRDKSGHWMQTFRGFQATHVRASGNLPVISCAVCDRAGRKRGKAPSCYRKPAHLKLYHPTLVGSHSL